MFTLDFWKAAGERALKTGAQFVLVSWAVGDGIFNVLTVDPAEAAGYFGGGVAVSLLTSLASGLIGDRGTPSLTRSETLRR